MKYSRLNTTNCLKIMRKLDLHGFTLEDAYQEFTDFIYKLTRKSQSNQTGKSGQIRKEFPHWAESSHQMLA